MERYSRIGRPRLRGFGLLVLAFFLSCSLSADTIGTSILPPTGFARAALPALSFGAFLRALPLWPRGRPVYLHDGALKSRQDVHHRVVRMDVGRRDLQQCADAIMRLRAEYLFGRGRFDDIAFNFTSGDRFPYASWARGIRPSIRGARVDFVRRGVPKSWDDRRSFRSYLDVIFAYAGTASLERELISRRGCRRPAVGDVFIQGGFPGHAVIIVDAAARRNVRGGTETIFLLAQSYMPAQEIHVLKNLHVPEISPWFRLDGDILRTPEWDFRTSASTCDLRGWPDR